MFLSLSILYFGCTILIMRVMWIIFTPCYYELIVYVDKQLWKMLHTELII